MKVCHDALTDIAWLLGEDRRKTGITWQEMFSAEDTAVVATCAFCSSDRVNTFKCAPAPGAETDVCQVAGCRKPAVNRLLGNDHKRRLP